MEMDLVQRRTVGFGFSFTQDRKDFPCQGPGAVGQFCPVQDVQDLCEAPVFMMMQVIIPVFLCMSMFMFMFVSMLMYVAVISDRRRISEPIEVRHVMVMIFMGCVKLHQKITGIQAGLFDAADHHFKPCQRKGRQGLAQDRFISAQIQQRSDGHISADAAFAFKIKFLGHFCSGSFLMARRLIWVAR